MTIATNNYRQLALVSIITLPLSILLLFLSEECLLNGVALFVLLLLTFMTWRSSDRGLHPAFLFQAFLLLFQGARLIVYFFDTSDTVWSLDLFVKPILYDLHTIRITLFLLCASSYCIYATSLLKFKYIQINTPVIGARWFLLAFFIFLPFYIYKNVFYLYYVLNHGGYIAIYANNGEHIQSVGVLIRFASNLCFAAYILYIVHEEDTSRLKKWMIFFIIVSLLELVIGLRGKYFVFLILNVFLYKRKVNKGFKLLASVIPIGIIIITSIIVAQVRENQTIVTDNFIKTFLSSQGISLGVTAVAVRDYDKYHPYSVNYLYNQLFTPFASQNNYSKGELFANDLTFDLNPVAFRAGFGTGSAFIAELYLLYGIPTVIIGTLIVGLVLSLISSYSKGVIGAVSFIILMGIIYLPRSSYLDPIASLIKLLIPCIIVYSMVVACCLVVYRKISFQ